MNRIYHGKVTAVKIPDGKDASGNPKRKKPTTVNPRSRHHELFQDGVKF
jgi:hypothetical protein